MKKSVRSFIGILLCILLVASILSGCGSQTGNSSNANKNTGVEASDKTGADNETSAEVSQGEPITIRMFNRVNASLVIENNPVIKEAEKLANVKLELEAPPINNYLEKLQILMASGDLPDLIYNWGGADANMETWAQNGLLAVLDDRIQNYPNLMSNIPENLWDAVRSVNDGKIYMVPRTHDVNHWGYLINDDWLDKVGLEAPTTLEELTEVCTAFTKNDPDGNGQNDTYGLSFSNPSLGANTIWNGSYFLASAFDLPIMNSTKDTDGQYKIKEKMSGYIPYLTYIKKLNDEGIIDPEFLINKIYVDRDKLQQKRIGIMYGHQSNVTGYESTCPGALETFSYHAPLQDSNGIATDYIIPAMWGGWMISATSKHIDGVLKFLDWGNTQEANTLFSLGIKGEHYNSYDPETRQVDRTKEQAAKSETVASGYMTIANAIGGKKAIIDGVDSQESYEKYTKDFNAAMALVTPLDVPAVKAAKIQNLNSTLPDIVKKKDDQEVKYIVGEITLEQFQDFLKNEYYPATAEAEEEYIQSMQNIGH